MIYQPDKDNTTTPPKGSCVLTETQLNYINTSSFIKVTSFDDVLMWKENILNRISEYSCNCDKRKIPLHCRKIALSEHELFILSITIGNYIGIIDKIYGVKVIVCVFTYNPYEVIY